MGEPSDEIVQTTPTATWSTPHRTNRIAPTRTRRLEGSICWLPGGRAATDRGVVYPIRKLGAKRGPGPSGTGGLNAECAECAEAEGDDGVGDRARVQPRREAERRVGFIGPRLSRGPGAIRDDGGAGVLESVRSLSLGQRLPSHGSEVANVITASPDLETIRTPQQLNPPKRSRPEHHESPDEMLLFKGNCSIPSLELPNAPTSGCTPIPARDELVPQWPFRKTISVNHGIIERRKPRVRHADKGEAQCVVSIPEESRTEWARRTLGQQCAHQAPAADSKNGTAT